jgi:hypothetical protein
MKPININKEGDTWTVTFPFDFETKDFVKSLGFWFDGDRKVWYTKDPAVAAKLDPDAAGNVAKQVEASQATNATISIPAPAGLEYLPYQKAGIAYAMERRNTLIADEMGLGKTIEAIGVINADPSIKSVLVVCPATLKLNWQNELNKWLVRPSAIAILGSKPSEAIRNSTISLRRFNNQKGANSSQKVENINSSTNSPKVLPFDGLDSPSTKRGIEPSMVKSSIAVEKINQDFVGRSKGDLPMSVPIGDNGTFPINDPRHIGQDTGIIRNTEDRSSSAVQTQGISSQPFVVIPKGMDTNPKFTDDLVDLCSLFDALEGSKECRVTYTGGPSQVAILIVNYDILVAWRDIIDTIDLSILIVDEAHKVKNPKAQRTQCLLGKWAKDPEDRIAPLAAKRKVFMTGTPIVNRPIEMWPLLQAIDPQGLGRNFMGYAKRYCAAYQGKHGWDFTGNSNLGELQMKLRANFMVRRLKQDVLTELPAKRRQIVVLTPSGAAVKAIAAEKRFQEQLAKIAHFEAAVNKAQAEADKELYQRAVEELKGATKIAFEDMSAVRHATAVAKIPYVVDFINEVLEDGDNKLVVMLHHHDVGRAIAEAFPGSAIVTGEVPVNKRQAEVERFQNDPSCRLFIGSIQAAGVGITLTAASHVVFAELDWVPGNVSQAEDRCHRIGQKDSVLVQHLVFDGSVDSRMAAIIVSKQAVIDSALDEGMVVPKVDVVKGPPPVVAKPIDPNALTDAQVEAIHTGIKFLAARCDGAYSEDGAGFNKLDTNFGHSLAAAPRLSQKQALAGKKLCNKYRRQLPVELLAVILQ